MPMDVNSAYIICSIWLEFANSIEKCTSLIFIILLLLIPMSWLLRILYIYFKLKYIFWAPGLAIAKNSN